MADRCFAARLCAATLLCVPFLKGCGGSGSDAAVQAPVEVAVTGPHNAVRLRVTVELALDENSRRAGLMGRNDLPVGHGLLIVLPIEAQTCITNADVRFPIDAVFADDNGIVVAIESAIPAGDAALRCHDAVGRILEVAAGVAVTVQLNDRLVTP